MNTERWMPPILAAVFIFGFGIFAGASAGPMPPGGEPALTFAGRTELPPFKGDFDHFAIDARRRRLYLAAEGGDRMDVIDLDSGALIRSVAGFDTPHSVFLAPGGRRLFVIAGGGSKVLDAGRLNVIGEVKTPPGADSIGYDAPRGRLYLVTGGKDVPMDVSYISEVDPATGKDLRDIRIDANHVEAMAVEQNGPRLFVNVTDKNALAVIDKRLGKVVAWWPIKEAKDNSPIAYDEKNHRLFVATRTPGKLIVLNADTGATVASFDGPAWPDQALWDAANRRVYVSGSDSTIGVWEEDDADHFRQLPSVKSWPRAKTSVLSPGRLWVAVSPGEGRPPAVVWYTITPRRK
ncbi:MAG: YncE family protein [Caulobacteraceae bacterium]